MPKNAKHVSVTYNVTQHEIKMEINKIVYYSFFKIYIQN